MTLVIGVGNPDRGDDAVGPVVASRVDELRLPDVDVLIEDSPASLTDLWDGVDSVVVVDAVHSGAAVGTVVTIDAVRHPLSVPIGARGTHGFGLSAAIELARVLDTLPPRLVVVGVEASDFTTGAALSAEVAAAVPVAVEEVRRAATR